MSAKEAAVNKAATDETAKALSQEWLDLAVTGKDTAVETLREFVGAVERAVPGHAKQREIIESGLQMVQSIIHAESDAVRALLRSAVVVNVNVNTDVRVNPEVHVDVPTSVNVLSREPTS